jgi:hypothetical protein
MTKVTVALSVIATALLAAPILRAGTIADGSQLYAIGGPVSVYFVSSSASYDSSLWLNAPGSTGPFLGNHTSSPGDSVTIPDVLRNTGVTLELNVQQTGDSWVTGPADLNSDGVLHAKMLTWTPTATIPVNGILVQFEDISGGGDRDYNDSCYVVTGVSTEKIMTHNPEPGTVFMLGGALIAFGSLRFRRKRA